MVTAFHFIPGVAPRSVVSLLHRLDDLQPCVKPALIDKVRRYLILYAGPYFVRVNEGEARAPAIRPGAQQQSGLIVQDVGALAVNMVREVVPEIMLKNSLHRRANVPF